ncbi:MAG: class I SAM-dependent methyltransferase [Chloroflexi bacterium]|nr:class I SAM-dependent methyltransferase [Chloroflexota bacterium]
MSIQDAYNHWSASYDTDENLTRDLDQKVTHDALADQHFHSILELGCGTGKNTALLAQIGTKVHALDFSPRMIEKAKEKVEAENVRFSIADLTRRWPCDDAAYDLISCNLVLEHIEDLSHIFSEAARTLIPKGKFFINELHPFRQYMGGKASFERGEETVEVDAFIHDISDFLSAAAANRLNLIKLNEFWHKTDESKPPRIVSFVFEKG